MLEGVEVDALLRRGRAERDAVERRLASADLGPCGQFVLDFTDALVALYRVGDFREGEVVAAELDVAC